MQVNIQKQLLADLEDSIDMQNNLDLDKSVYIISLLNSLHTNYRNSEKKSTYVNLDSQELKSVISNYSEYMTFLIKYDFIKKIKNHSSMHQKCNAYWFSEKYELDEVETYRISVSRQHKVDR